MAERSVHESDLSGQLILDEASLARITVWQHPELEQPKVLDAAPEELERVGQLAIEAVVFDVTMPGETEPTRHVMTAANFGKLAVKRSMSDVLTNAAPIMPDKQRRVRSETKDYETLELAGQPHRGKVSDDEAHLVRENLEAVNERLRAAGQRVIDPENPDHRKRYGFDGSRESASDGATVTQLPLGEGAGTTRVNDPA